MSHWLSLCSLIHFLVYRPWYINVLTAHGVTEHDITECLIFLVISVVCIHCNITISKVKLLHNYVTSLRPERTWDQTQPANWYVTPYAQRHGKSHALRAMVIWMLMRTCAQRHVYSVQWQCGKMTQLFQHICEYTNTIHFLYQGSYSFLNMKFKDLFKVFPGPFYQIQGSDRS